MDKETISTSCMGSTTSYIPDREAFDRAQRKRIDEILKFYEPEPTLAERIFKFLKNKFGKSK